MVPPQPGLMPAQFYAECLGCWSQHPHERPVIPGCVGFGFTKGALMACSPRPVHCKPSRPAPSTLLLQLNSDLRQIKSTEDARLAALPPGADEPVMPAPPAVPPSAQTPAAAAMKFGASGTALPHVEAPYASVGALLGHLLG